MEKENVIQKIQKLLKLQYGAESKLVLAWDSMYGPLIDSTRNGKWFSEQRGDMTGQIVHGIIACRPIPECKVGV